MADHNQPTNTTGYSSVLTTLKDRMIDLARWFDPATTTPTNIPANSYRFNAASLTVDKYVSSTWGAVARVLSTNNSTALTSLGFSAFVQTLLGATSALSFRTLTLSAPSANVLHNANFGVAQINKWNYDPTLGLDSTDTAPMFLVDRWAIYAVAGGNVKVQRGTSTSGNYNGTLVLPTDATFSTTTQVFLRQRIPFNALMHLAGARCCISIGLADAALASATATLRYIGGATIATGSVLAGATVVFTMPSTILNDFNTGLELVFTLNYSSSAKNTVISKPMLNLGASPTTFEPRDDLAVCRKFYEPFTDMVMSGYSAVASIDYRSSYQVTPKWGYAAKIETIGTPANCQKVNAVHRDITLSNAYTNIVWRVQSAAVGAWLAAMTSSGITPRSHGVGVRAAIETA